MFSGTQALPENRRTYVRTQNWQVCAKLVRPRYQLGQTALVKILKRKFGLHHWIGLVE
jgi:hypothetical protein